MSEALAPHEYKRLTFTGKFQRFGKKRGWKGQEQITILLLDIRDIHGNPLADHLWFNLTKEFVRLDLQPGNIVRFDARVQEYLKGYQGRRNATPAGVASSEDWDNPLVWDYKLSHPTRVQKMTDDLECLPLLAVVKP